MEYRAFSSKLIYWYRYNQRELPWRETSDPYKIWLSEILLQQTRVNQGLPYYLKFVETFPAIKNMADAPEDKILRLWQGLGYYSRAKNLHECAKTVVANYNGRFPAEFSELLKLPGIGPYTAAAISSIAFNKPHAVVDGNVQRVLSRFLGITENIAEPSTTKKMHLALENLIDPTRPGLFNQAMMELGAMICKPKSPSCEICPLADSCFANLNQRQGQLPFKLKKIKRKNRYFYYWVLIHGDQIAMRKRDHGNIWKGLYEFYLIEKKERAGAEIVFDDFLEKIIRGKQGVQLFEARKHVLTHQDIFSFFFLVNVNERQKNMLISEGGYRFYSPDEINELPKPILIDKFLRQKIID